MNLEQVARDLKAEINDEILVSESLSKYTTWRIGGPADVLIFPTTIQSVQKVKQFALSENIPLYVIGNGSNVLIKDKGLRGLVLSLSKFTKVAFDDNKVTAQAGVILPALVKKALDKGLTGLEFAAGIPASVGGATVMNAGTYLGQMADIVQEVKVVDEKGELLLLSNQDLDYTYRYSSLKGRKVIVVETLFCCQPQLRSVTEAKEQLKATLEKRKGSQPLNYPNAGSVFKNPPGDSAGRLIEAAGLKGIVCGEAQISEKHANFIVNLGKATATDVINLMEKTQQIVAEKFGIKLEPEVIVLG